VTLDNNHSENKKNGPLRRGKLRDLDNGYVPRACGTNETTPTAIAVIAGNQPRVDTGLYRDRAWWAAEAERIGTAWPGVVGAALEMIVVAGIVEPSASTFSLACEQADREQQPCEIRGAAAMAAAPTTIEALMLSLRRGASELARPDTLRRLSTLDQSQLEAVCVRVQAFQQRIAPVWCADDVDLLISAWRKFREQR
jgi:hypothetical protein